MFFIYNIKSKNIIIYDLKLYDQSVLLNLS